MPDADTSRSRLLFRAEAAFNETIPATPTSTDLRFTRDNFKLTNVSVVSNDVRSDRGRSDLLLVGHDVVGGFSFELASLEYDLFLASALSGAWATNVLKSGVVALESYKFERGLLDVGQYFLFSGCSVNELNLTVASHQIVTGDFNFMGALAAVTGTSAMTGAIGAKSTSAKMASGPGINNITINGAAIGVGVREIRLAVRNNLRTREVVDSLNTRPFGRGTLDITGSVTMYFATSALYNYFVNNTSFALAFSVADGLVATPGTKRYDFVVPVCKPPDDSVEITGVDSDIIETFAFRALQDPVLGCQLQITRVTTP